MSNKLQPVRGTHDILPQEYGGDFEKFHYVVETARDLATLYGFREMATPIFEQTEVFSRSMGETSDVVSKEMFTFETRGGESVTLRPEFTAGIARAFISNGMQQHLPLKLFSTGPLFRYERPQKGRQRQFHQVNFEWLGDDSWMADVEVIELAGRFLQSISAIEDSCTLHINTLGDVKSRERYRDALVSFLTPFAEKLSEDSKRRLAENPLRILDSKDKGDRDILINAPVMTNYLSDVAKKRFDKVCNYLSKLEFFNSIKVDPALVRGLDYYTDIVFEFVATSGDLGAQNTVLAGGRYDGLIEQMGGKPTPAIGFAAGVERLSLLTGNKKEEKSLNITVIPFEEVDPEIVLDLVGGLRAGLYNNLRKTIMSVDIDWQGKLSKRLEKAAKNGATHVVIISPDEMKDGMVIVKNMETRNEQKISISGLSIEKLKEIFGI
ncbi:MAG: histidine--tRNA ligase [Pseudomonadota bacterium]